jgi:23S rRNA (adenine2503-C2)-methyltransferase
MMRTILDLTPAELETWLRAQGQPAMRARQVRRWLLQGRAESFEAMTDLPLAVRQALADAFLPLGTSTVRHLRSSDGTSKLLLSLQEESSVDTPSAVRNGGNPATVECVLLQEDDRRTACISTQVGCGMGCVFCASGLAGLERNLTSGEILEQLIRVRNLLPADERLNHVVVMGMGEPLANLDNLLAALEVACSKEGLGLGARHITISTVGLPAKIRRLADLKKQYHLAVSLHAPSDRLRNEIVPTNDKTGLDEILAAADYFYAQTHRQVTYEYVLLREVNDGPRQAEELARLLSGRQAHVNLIPFNDVEGLPYRRSRNESISDFVARLRRRGLVVHVRKRKGADIDAACGQLRRAALAGQGEAPLVPLGVRLPDPGG